MKNKFNIGDRVVSDDGTQFIVDFISLVNEKVCYSSRDTRVFEEKNLKLAPKTETYYQYIYKICENNVWISQKLYKNDDDFKQFVIDATWFEKIPIPREVPCE
jgi:hypothetical protein